MPALKKPYNIKEISDVELEAEFMRRYNEDLTAGDFTPEQMAMIFREMASVEHSRELLKSIIKADRVRFFNAPVEGQAVVRGATARTIWMVKMMQNPKK